MSGIPAERQEGIPEIAVAQVRDGEPILDVRNQDEWDRGHAPLAQHIPLHELEARLAELPRDRPIVVTCRGGGRASRAVAFLVEQGFDARSLQGGMFAWMHANRPLRHDGDGAPTVQ